jgi:hypothetical protein
MTSRLLVSLAVLVLVILVIPSISRADGFGVYAYGQTITAVPGVIVVDGVQVLSGAGNFVDQSFFTGSVLPQAFYSNSLTGNGQQITYLNQNALYTATATATVFSISFSDGLLRGSIQASVGDLDPSTGVNATADAYLLWQDTLTVISDSSKPPLPYGTPVAIHPTSSLKGTFTASGNGDASLLSQTNFNGNFTGATSSDTGFFQNLYEASANQAPPIAINNKQEQALNTFVGAQIGLEEQLFLSASNLGPEFAANLDVANTAFLNIQDLTPGTSLVSASGINYATVGETTASVPEPSSVCLLFVGMLWLGIFSRRQSLC